MKVKVLNKQAFDYLKDREYPDWGSALFISFDWATSEQGYDFWLQKSKEGPTDENIELVKKLY